MRSEVARKSLASAAARADGGRGRGNRWPLCGATIRHCGVARSHGGGNNERSVGPGRRPSPGMSRRCGELNTDTVVRQSAAGRRVRDHDRNLLGGQRSNVTPVPVLPLRRWRRRRRARRRRSGGVFRPRRSCRTATGPTWRRRFWYGPVRARPDASTSCLWRRVPVLASCLLRYRDNGGGGARSHDL